MSSRRRARTTDATDLAALPDAPDAWRTPAAPAPLEPAMTDRVVAIVRDARSVHVQWSTSAQSVRRARASLDGPARFVLRIYVVDDEDGSTAMRTIRVDSWIGAHTVTIRQRGARVVAAVGFESQDAFAHVARASAVRLPKLAEVTPLSRLTMARVRPGTRFVDLSGMTPAMLSPGATTPAPPRSEGEPSGELALLVRVQLPPVTPDDPRVQALAAKILTLPVERVAVAVSPIALELLAAHSPEAVARLRTAGELLTTPATDAFFPLLDHDRSSMSAQLTLAVRIHARHLGAAPAGVMFADGGYESRTDTLLKAAGLRYAIVDAEAVRRASETPKSDIYGAISCPGSAVAILARDPEARRVVAADIPNAPILPDPGYAQAVADAFVSARQAQCVAIRKHLDSVPLVVCELSIDELHPALVAAVRASELALTTPAAWLDAHPELQRAWPGPSHAGGLVAAMCMAERSWLLRHLHTAGTRLDELVEAEDPRASSAGRELALAQSGAWLRGLAQGDGEALERILEHLHAFAEIAADPTSTGPQRPWLKDLEASDFKVVPPKRPPKPPTDRAVDRYAMPRPNEIW